MKQRAEQYGRRVTKKDEAEVEENEDDDWA